ncbi:hypothetical protein Zmor_000927 [Zophobas morio]|uniref:Uncharacterized protein n=1 Tax=Zophobas morio TaxID=2755281 RepID=A0AA38J1N1_9CUCU|nr:hypothetical protein Zmor_000927 [Zophobas morio]
MRIELLFALNLVQEDGFSFRIASWHAHRFVLASLRTSSRIDLQDTKLSLVIVAASTPHLNVEYVKIYYRNDPVKYDLDECSFYRVVISKGVSGNRRHKTPAPSTAIHTKFHVTFTPRL